MASKHKAAPTFLRSRFFEGLKSFRDFEARTEKLANTTEVGDAFEILVEAYLHLDKVLNAKNVWMVGAIPLKIRQALNLPGDSKGIDGVYEDASGNLIPYQVKYRTDRDSLPYGEVSSFLGITEESLKDRVIFTNARNLAADITKRKGLRSVKAAQFHELSEADFKRIHAWLTDKKPEFKRWSPQPHQKEAVEEITAALQQSDRTMAVMACGTGKTLVALWAAEAQDPKTVLVLVPSLALLSQTLPDWCKQTSWGERFRYLCVCSDASVDRSAKEDEYALKQSDLEFPVTTDPKQVKAFLEANKSGVNVIFSTYQSAEVVAKGLKGQSIDLGIFDEAHKTTGPKDGLFAFGLSDKNIRIKKRLFLTATPRHYNLSKRDKDGDFQTVSMSDEAVYGKVSYRLSFSAAVAAGIIVPYKVIISVSVNKEVDAELLKRGHTIVRRDELQAKWVANQIALKRAIEKTRACKIITFHSRVKLAEDFAGDGAQGFTEHVKGFDVFHVNGGQNAADRKAVLKDFKVSPRGLITNARCLTEGVDVPAVDMVAFIDPKKSRIDIAQAAGRAMRQSKATNKKLGYIVVPLFIEQKKGETEAEAFTRSGFDEVAEVLAAMLESDDDLVDTIKEMQEARGRGGVFNPRQLHEKIEVIGPVIVLDDLARSIDVRILDSLGFSWDKWFGLLQKYHKREGHSQVPASQVEDGLRIGVWCSIQRMKRARLSIERKSRLGSLGFCWDPMSELWETSFSALKKFRGIEGHCRAPQGKEFEGLNLGSWVARQRKEKKSMTQERISRLDSIGFCWDPLIEKLETGFEMLEKYYRREGHSSVPQHHEEDGFKIGMWVSIQRRMKSSMPSDRIERLTKIGFVWNTFDEAWDRNFNAIFKFKNREGHCMPSSKHREDGCKIGVWSIVQRMKKPELSPDKISRLDELGFCWDPLAEQFEQGYAALEKFALREGHCNIPKNHHKSGLNLSIWVQNKRTAFKKKLLSADQINRLNRIGFSWNPKNEQWDKYFSSLKIFSRREGNCNVMALHKEEGLRLGAWIRHQRTQKKRLTHEQIGRLNSLGFQWEHNIDRIQRTKWAHGIEALKSYFQREGHIAVPQGHYEMGIDLSSWTQQMRSRKEELSKDKTEALDSLNFSWDPVSDKWENGYIALVKFRERENNCHVPQDHQEDGINLGEWASRQRSKKNRLTPERLNRLNANGFSWTPLLDNWEKNFSALLKFTKREGHVNVPNTHTEDGLSLGTWVGRQRKKKGDLNLDQIARLDSLHFIWSPYEEQWTRFYATLQKFHSREGNCLVPQDHIEDGMKLGTWVSNQRSMMRSKKLNSSRVEKLSLLGFTWKA